MKKLKGKFGYGIGAIGLDLSYGLFYSYLAKYFTDTLDLNYWFLLLLTPLARIWDGINDPMMGTIVDNTRTKMGKYRPWILIGSCCNAVVLSLLFTNPGLAPDGLSIHIYVAVFYVLWGMTNTMADIPYWSMVPSFTSDPNERNIIATIARTFSGLGQGIISILTPVMLPILSVTMINGEKVADSKGYSTWAIICAIALIGFSSLSVSQTKERVITASTSEKFSFKKIFKVLASNDQLRIFMVFAMLSNAGYYMISGVGVYFFDVVVGDPSKQSTFNLIGAVGSVLGLAVVPVLTKFISRKRTYQTSLCLVLAGFIGMLICAKAQAYMIMNFCYLLASIGVASMFVSQTVFLADIVDYGEIKMGNRAEAITFSMKGFLQKMAYTIQTIILFSGLIISNYAPRSAEKLTYTQSEQNTITFMMLICPIVLVTLSLIVFSTKYKLHGEFMENITKQINEKHVEFKEEV